MLNSQRYSTLVFDEISKLDASLQAEEAVRYKALCKRAGGIFRTVGLAQFATFIAAKGQKLEYYRWLSEHLRRELNEIGTIRAREEEAYLAEIRKLDLPSYMQASRVMLGLLQWHKRLAEVLIEKEEESHGEETA